MKFFVKTRIKRELQNIAHDSVLGLKIHREGVSRKNTPSYNWSIPAIRASHWILKALKRWLTPHRVLGIRRKAS